MPHALHIRLCQALELYRALHAVITMVTATRTASRGDDGN